MAQPSIEFALSPQPSSCDPHSPQLQPLNSKILKGRWLSHKADRNTESVYWQQPIYSLMTSQTVRPQCHLYVNAAAEASASATIEKKAAS